MEVGLAFRFARKSLKNWVGIFLWSLISMLEQKHDSRFDHPTSFHSTGKISHKELIQETYFLLYRENQIRLHQLLNSLGSKNMMKSQVMIVLDIEHNDFQIEV